MPLKQSVIYWNGNLGLCCIDYSNDIKLSNIKKDGYVKTLFSDEVIKKRKQGFKKQHKLCIDCTLGNADYMGETHRFKNNPKEIPYNQV
jgi:hypothetical protein